MAVFVSYSARDRAPAQSVLTALRRAHEQMWLDEELGGGEAWWRAILEQIRTCEVFIVALSNNSLQSKPCQAELRYAQDLRRPILPVQIGPVDSMRLNPLAAMQAIDYQNPGVANSIELVTAVHEARARTAPLPSPLPDEPPVPFAYLMRVAAQLSAPELNPREQAALVAELRAGLEDDGADEPVRSDIAKLLHMLRDRPDVTWRTRSDIDAVLASIDSSKDFPTYPQAPPPTYPHERDPRMYPAAPPPSAPPPSESPQRRFRWPRRDSTKP
jgi:hypothetical protein